MPMKTMRFGVCGFAVLFLFSALSLNAQQQVTFPSGDGQASGLLYLPQGGGAHPAIVVIQEWWGVDSWIKEQATNFAAHGYVALAVDLYHGKVADSPEMAHELMRGLPQDQGVRDLVAGFKYLESRKDVKHDRIGAVGWCMGGGYALQLAIAEPELKAVSVNYGALATDRDQLAKIHAAVLGNFGGQDRGIPPEAVHGFEGAMKILGKPVDAKVYPDAGHAFENPNNKTGYRPEDAADAQARTAKFFEQNLGR
ncbi:dienelactone hydrolase family protein [Acidobacteria bacterium AB60]|nr:dienelactone hydrolase family protein [Acidobacteria bacterium AB60]